MSSTVGEKLKITIFGGSHSPAIGVTVDGFPAGYRVDADALSRFLERRAPGRDGLSTARREDDSPEFLAGITDGVTNGEPITAVIRNSDVRRTDYDRIRSVPRPSHADYTAWVKYGGKNDQSGGGHFSGRLTAALCVAGGLSLGLLSKNGIEISARPVSIGGVSGSLDEMKEAVARAKADGDSVGGIVECTATGVPAGIGDPIFDGIENRIAKTVFGIPAVRGIEFGAGFGAAAMRGSVHNDPFIFENGVVRTKKNDHGGVLGGITSGMPVVFRVAFKPTPSIAGEQDSVDLETGENVKITVGGRHDPCVVFRAVPAVEAACAAAVLDAMLSDGYPIETEG